jgi:hypothetical protein
MKQSLWPDRGHDGRRPFPEARKADKLAPMTRPALASALFLITILGACAPEEKESVEERFRRTEAAIENTARALEAETENAVRQVELTLENQGTAAIDNRVDTGNVAAEAGEDQER